MLFHLVVGLVFKCQGYGADELVYLSLDFIVDLNDLVAIHIRTPGDDFIQLHHFSQKFIVQIFSGQILLYKD